MSQISPVERPAGAAAPETIVAGLVDRGRRAMAAFESSSQARVDEVVTALAWSVYKPEHARVLAEMAVEDTGLGNAADKIVKNQRKTFGTLRDLMRVRTVGVIEEDREKRLVKYAKPVGVVAAVTPSTNPAATPVNKAMMAVKGRNAVIIAPSPAGLATTTRTVDIMREALEKVGAPADLVQVLPAPVNKALTHALMAAADLN
ncbi:MAG TPA: aldehyde dehydrogenase family protein, partial [Gammaproteobacteria bacterium]